MRIFARLVQYPHYMSATGIEDGRRFLQKTTTEPVEDGGHGEDRVCRWRARRALFRAPDEAERTTARDHDLRKEPSRRDPWLGRSVLGRPARAALPGRPAVSTPDRGSVVPLGRPGRGRTWHAGAGPQPPGLWHQPAAPAGRPDPPGAGCRGAGRVRSRRGRAFATAGGGSRSRLRRSEQPDASGNRGLPDRCPAGQ